MYTKTSILASAMVLAGQISSASASTCFNYGIGPAGTCYVDPRSPERFQAYINAPANNASCQAGGDFDMQLIYTDNQGNTRTSRAVAAATFTDGASTASPVNFNVPLTSMAVGSPATLLVTAYNTDVNTPVTQTFTYTQTQQSSISYVTSTTTATAYTTVLTSSTTSVVGKHITTTTPGYIRTVTSKTGVATATTQPSVVTTSTIIPAPLTQTVWKSATVTSTFSCNPLQTQAPFRKMKRNFLDATNSAPSCAVPTTTYVVNKVVGTTTTVTSTNTILVMSSTFTISTSTATAAKTKYVGATSTSTTSLPVITYTSYAKAARATNFATSTRVMTAWVSPKGTGVGACKPVQTLANSVQASFTASV